MKRSALSVFNAITDVPGIRVGNAQDLDAGTGCTVIITEGGAVTGVDVRGGAPGTREIACLLPTNLITHTHAIYLGGGSSYGLEGAYGVMQYLEERDVGFNAGVTKVPIVPGAVLFDLRFGDYKRRPDKPMGYTAAERAASGPLEQGNIGAGTGATIGKVVDEAHMMKGGLGTASIIVRDLVVGALVIVNCFGDVIDPSTGDIIAGTLSPDKGGFADSARLLAIVERKENESFTTSTTIGVVATNAGLTKSEATKVAMMAHNGYARSIRPVHTMFDGDTIFCLSTGSTAAMVSAVGTLAADAIALAVVSAVKAARTLHNVPTYYDIIMRSTQT